MTDFIIIATYFTVLIIAEAIFNVFYWNDLSNEEKKNMTRAEFDIIIVFWPIVLMFAIIILPIFGLYKLAAYLLHNLKKLLSKNE